MIQPSVATMGRVSRIWRRTLAATLLCAPWLAPSNASAVDFSDVSVQVSGVTGCTHILVPGNVTGTAIRSGNNLVVTIPADGTVFTLAATVTIPNIPVTSLAGQPLQTATLSMTGAETISSSGLALLRVEDGQATEFDASGLFSATCSFNLVMNAQSPLVSTDGPNRPSTTALQDDIAIARSTNGVFFDTTNASKHALAFLQGVGRGARGPATSMRIDGTSGSFEARGLSAGDARLPIGIWGNARYTRSENDSVADRAKSTRWHGSVGIDAALADTVLVGLAFGYENDDADTTFNGGNADIDAVTIATYVGLVLSEHWSADAAVGRSFIETEQFRTSAGARITSEVEGDRRFAAANLNYARQAGKWRLLGRAGAFWLFDRQEAFAESNGTAVAESRFRASRANLGAEVAREIGAFEPFVNATYNWTFSQTVTNPSFDRTDLLLGVGARYFGADTLSGSLEYNTLLGRENVEEHSVNLLMRADF